MDSFLLKQQPDKYVMSLDDLDVSLLPSTYYSRLSNDKISLWNVNNGNGYKDDYYQFEIKPKEEITSEMDFGVDDIPSQETTICYICNIEVPIAYLVDHEDSLKHKAFAQIADVVLNRARKHMLKKAITKNVQRADSVYFCAPCVILVRVKDKKRHEKSNAHKRSISLDKLLHELVAIYTEEDTENVDSDPELTNSTVDANDNCIKAEVSEDFERNTVVISDIKGTLRKYEAGIDRGGIDDLATQMEYIKLIDQYDTEKLNTLTPDNGNIRIETQDGCQVVVSEDNFHGLMRIGKKHIQCKICKVIVKDEKEHKASEEHIRKIVKPFADKHCVRNLDSSWSHCVICNAIIDNSDVHALCNQAHEKLLQKALGIDDDQTGSPSKRRSFVYNCSICNISIHINDIDTHMNGYRHTMLLKLKQEKDPNFDNEDSKENELNNDVIKTNNNKPMSQVTLNNTEHYCATCNITINVNSIESHQNGSKHAMNSKSPLHYVMKLVDETKELICRVCGVYVVDNPSQVKSHVDIEEHRSKLKEFLEANRVAEDGDRFYCKPCRVFITKMNEFCHIQKLTHESNLIAFKEKEERDLAYEHYYLCHICEVLIPNNPENIAQHNDGERHKTNIAQVGLELAEITKTNLEPKPDTTAKLHEVMADTINPKELQCKVCVVIVPNKQEAIDTHIKGTRHRSNLRAMMEDNLIEIRNEKYYCNPCKVFVAAEREFLHIERPKHKKKVAKYKSKQANADKTDVQESVVTKTHLKNTPNAVQSDNASPTVEKLVKIESVDLYPLLKHHFKDAGANGIICRVCDVSLIANTQKDVLDHATTTEHLETYNNVIAENLIFESDFGDFFCGICNCLLPGKGELLHAYSQKHSKKRVEVFQNADFCVHCNIPIGDDMKEHVTSYQHVDNLKRQQKFLQHCKDCGALLKANPEGVEQHKDICLLMRIHGIVFRSRQCYCYVCVMFFPKELIESHVVTNRHRLLINAEYSD